MAEKLVLDLLTDAEIAAVHEADKTATDFIARFEAWAGRKTDAPSYTLKGAALMALSLAAGDTVTLPPIFGTAPTYLNLYIMLVGPSTTMRKTTVLGYVRDLLPTNQTTRQDYIRVLDDVSMQAFNKCIAEAGKEMAPVLFSVDEVAGLFENLRRHDSYLKGFDKTLMKAYDHSPIAVLRVNSKAESDTGAFVNTFAATTPEPLMEVLSSDDVESGLLPRFIVFDAREAMRGTRRSLMARMEGHEDWTAEADDLKGFLYAIAKGRADGIPSGVDVHGNPTFPSRAIPISRAALERLDFIDATFTDEVAADTTSLGAIKGRAFWHIVKMAGLYALARDGINGEVQLIDVLRGAWLVESTVSDLVKMQEEVGANYLERRVNEVMALLSDSRQKVRQSTVARKLRLSARDMGELANTLLMRELIAIEAEGTSRVWRAL